MSIYGNIVEMELELELEQIVYCLKSGREIIMEREHQDGTPFRSEQVSRGDVGQVHNRTLIK